MEPMMLESVKESQNWVVDKLEVSYGSLAWLDAQQKTMLDDAFDVVYQAAV